MRAFKIMASTVVLGALVLSGGHVGSYAMADAADVAPADKAEWSDALNGLRVRLSAPGGTTYRGKALLPLVVEVQNASDKPITFSTLWPTVRVLAKDGEGKWLGIPAMGPELGEWVARTGNLEPGKITTLRFAFQSLRFVRPLKVGEKIALRVSAPTQRPREGKLPEEVSSPPITIDVARAFPRPLEEADVAGDWKMHLACRVAMGMLGSQSVHVDAQGTATLVQNTQRNGQPIKRRVTMALPASQLAELSAALRKAKVWTLSEGRSQIAFPDEGAMDIALLSPTGGSVVGTFANHLESDQPVVRDTRQVVEGLIHYIETRDAAQQENPK
ncbi:MAG TPA: hypothetical protein VG269_26190 [Tepidisphaeraceae bacterium]|jgi:hypothetical protein|nr:hypothetical protein [Tepidisphaeraceae bacterium]